MPRKAQAALHESHGKDDWAFLGLSYTAFDPDGLNIQIFRPLIDYCYRIAYMGKGVHLRKALSQLQYTQFSLGRVTGFPCHPLYRASFSGRQKDSGYYTGTGTAMRDPTVSMAVEDMALGVGPQYTYSHREGEEERVQPERRLEGQQFTELGRKYQHD